MLKTLGLIGKMALLFLKRKNVLICPVVFKIPLEMYETRHFEK